MVDHIHLKTGKTSDPVTIPAGAAYRVYEEEYGSYTPVVREMTGVMAGGAEVQLEFHNVPGSTSGEPAVYLPLPAVRKYVSGNNVPAQEFTFTLQGVKEGDGNAYVPMPAHHEDSVTAGRGESASFGYITYHPVNAGTYIYTIREKVPEAAEGETSPWTYDQSVYTYIVEVEYEDGKLTVTPSMQKGGTDTAQSEFTFNNTYFDPTEVPEPGPEPEPEPDPSRPEHNGNHDGHGDGGGNEDNSGGPFRLDRSPDADPAEPPLKELPDTGVTQRAPFLLGLAGGSFVAISFIPRKKRRGPHEN